MNWLEWQKWAISDNQIDLLSGIIIVIHLESIRWLTSLTEDRRENNRVDNRIDNTCRWLTIWFEIIMTRKEPFSTIYSRWNEFPSLYVKVYKYIYQHEADYLVERFSLNYWTLVYLLESKLEFVRNEKILQNSTIRIRIGREKKELELITYFLLWVR